MMSNNSKFHKVATQAGKARKKAFLEKLVGKAGKQYVFLSAWLENFFAF